MKKERKELIDGTAGASSYSCSLGHLPHHLLLLLIVHPHRLVVVQPLGIQHLGQVPLVPRRLLQLRSLVLEPDLDLVLIEAKLARKEATTFLCEIPVRLELGAQLAELLGAEGRPRPFVLCRWLALLLDLPHPGTRAGPIRVPGAENPGWPQLTVGPSHHPGRTVPICLGSLVGRL